MTLQTWWLFVTMTFVVSATPGPNMLLVMSSSARLGFRATISTMAGCMTALLTMMSVSAAGLGAVLQAFPSVFDALRWAGAAYLVYLGIKSWRAPVPDIVEDASQAMRRQPRKSAALFRQGVLVAASNPKAILFAAAFLPQFIHPQAPKLPQFLILLSTFAVIESSWYVIYAGSGQRLAGYLRRAGVRQSFNRLTGGVFIGFAAVMAAVRD
jgi:threonine/homoserine/homoserine lactone efflux protein